MEKTVSPRQRFVVPETYDFEKSSEANYASPDTPFVGRFKHIRAQLDYSYHKRYCVERQLLQDLLIDRFLKTRVVDHQQNVVCEVPLENWIVFTAGPMGAGKGHTMQWLYQSGLFPMDAFVNVDPDALRMLLPETAQYNHLDDKKTGHLTQKEVGYISEILSYDALQKGKNVLVDGSLRNAHWYLKYFRNLRDKFPIIKIAILHVTAKPETVLLRARNRAKVTGRHVPEETILESMRTIPESLRILSPHSEFVATFFNEDEESEPRLAYCCMQEVSSSASAFPSTSTLAPSSYNSTASVSSMAESAGVSGKIDRSESVDGVEGKKERKDRPLIPIWCMRETHTIAPEHGRLDVALRMVHDNNNIESQAPLAANITVENNNSLPACNASSYAYGKCFTNPYFEQCNLHLDTTKADATVNNNNNSEEASNAAAISSSTINPSIIASTNTASTTASTAPTFTYTLVDCAHHSEVVLDSWKGLFSNTWEMKCALPDTLLSRLNSDDLSISAPIVCDMNDIGSSHTADCGSTSVCSISLGHTTEETTPEAAQDCNICCDRSSEDGSFDQCGRKNDGEHTTSPEVVHKRQRTIEVAVISGSI